MRAQQLLIGLSLALGLALFAGIVAAATLPAAPQAQQPFTLACTLTGSAVACTGSLPAATPSATASATATPPATPSPSPSPSTSYLGPWHTNIVATTFWAGEEYKPASADGSQACSTYDSQWAYHYGLVTIGAEQNAGCTGSPVGSCDGVAAGTTVSTFSCNTEKRTSANGYFPTRMTPHENPFYADAQYDDLNNATAFKNRCTNIPWARTVDPAGAHCADAGYSYLKNAWLQITGPNGATCYGQIEDAGPDFYNQPGYVFAGDPNRPPADATTNNAGIDVSPALNGCLGFAALDGDNDHVSWRFVSADQVPSGPWKQVITHSPPTPYRSSTMAALFDHAAFEDYERRVGHPSSPLPLGIREAYAKEGIALPDRRLMLVVLTPPTPDACALPGETDPPPSRCHVCGAPTEALQNARAHAVAGFEAATSLTTGELMRFLVTHCDRCLGSAHCQPDAQAPGAMRVLGPDGAPAPADSFLPFGFCESLPAREISTNLLLFPGAHLLGRVIRWGVAASGLWLLSHAAVVMSRGAQQAEFQGPATACLFPNDSTAGHGYNLGGVRILSGVAPGTGDAAETGTLGINWALPNPAFGAPSAATPTSCTANAVTNVSAAATITAGYGRMVENADTFGLSTVFRRFQFSVGTSGADMNFNTLAISAGGTCSLTALSVTHG